MERFLEMCLLLLLFEKPGYGYGLIEQLEYFGFLQEELNVGSLYRVLRKMENEKLVISDWEKSAQGPRRRTYEITNTGKKELDQWIIILKTRVSRIEKFIERYDNDLKKG